MSTPTLNIVDPGDRETLGAFVARAVRLEADAAVRLRMRSPGVLEAWVATPFDTLVTRTVSGDVTPADVTVSGSELLAALTVAGGDVVDPGPARDLLWQSELPATTGWRPVDELPAGTVAELADRGIALAKDNPGPKGTPPASLLDQTVLTVSGSELEVTVPMRCLFALSGMGFIGSGTDAATDDVVRVAATDSWLRLDARYGAVVRRRHALLPLLL